MGERATCHVCNNHLSAIHSAFIRGNPCPQCGAAESDSLAVEIANGKRKQYLAKCADKQIAERAADLEKQNGELEAMAGFLWDKLASLSWQTEEFLREFQEVVEKAQEFKARFK